MVRAIARPRDEPRASRAALPGLDKEIRWQLP